MINLLVPAVFADDMVDTYAQLNARYAQEGIKISEVYGALPRGHSAREPELLPQITENDLFDYAARLRDISIDFHYTLNSPVITYEQIDKYYGKFLKKLWDGGIRFLTIASPLLIEYVRRAMPGANFNITVSTIAQVDSLKRIKQAKLFGADKITLDLRTNRDFKFLKHVKELKKSLDIEFMVIANEFCGDCLMRHFHYNLQSLKNYKCGDAFFDAYPFNVCARLFLLKPADVLKLYWILPDWIRLYHEEFGIDWIKVVGRTVKNIAWHKFVIKEYLKQNYKGNILRLEPDEGDDNTLFIDADYIKDNNYLEHFVDNCPDCRSVCGISCHFCDTLSKGLSTELYPPLPFEES
jgi:collagenase-like PrtC family protease